MPEDNWKLQFDSKEFDAVLPFEEVSTVVRTIGNGPNMQDLEHCHFASTIKELCRRAPLFHMRVPICNKGKARDWPTGAVGLHLKIVLPVAITSSSRSSDRTFDRLVGYVIFQDENGLSDFSACGINEVIISNYSAGGSREGEISMSRGLYLKIIEAWKGHLFETS